MAVAVRRNTPLGIGDLVHISESYEAAERAASRFKENRMYNDDTYSIHTVNVFVYHPDIVISEFTHQVVPYPDDFLYYLFHKDRLESHSWLKREYKSHHDAASYNSTFPSTPYYYVRADTEDEAVDRFRTILKQLG